ncbi:MAG: VPLPA-CTERM sorting domain-containing protein [Methylococcaceae bacterium]|nr:VPLPA-CTERM sorting domain-containing protein [Methylococcaceae bacterium]MDP3903103.1 VPLPA-CTERM sorting domain-containing protein [Methylococcaceae bacterium]
MSLNFLPKRTAQGKISATALLISLCLSTQPAQAALTFNFTYLSPGQGFDDPTFGAARKLALNSAADLLGEYFVNYTATLDYDVTSSSVNESRLASAGSSYSVIPGTFQRTTVQTKILTNGATDSNYFAADGHIDWNFYENWGLSDSVAANEFDFKTVAIHELLHSFGFSSVVNQNGGGLEDKNTGTPDTWATFDKFLTNADGVSLINNAGVFAGSNVNALTSGSGSVLFNGQNAKDANGGVAVNLYAPTIFSPGSSISHLDDDTLALSELIMASSVSAGQKSRELSAIELGILRDIGYTQIVAPAEVPVPAAAWLMLSGLLGLVSFGRRKTAL